MQGMNREQRQDRNYLRLANLEDFLSRGPGDKKEHQNLDRRGTPKPRNALGTGCAAMHLLGDAHGKRLKSQESGRHVVATCRAGFFVSYMVQYARVWNQVVCCHPKMVERVGSAARFGQNGLS